MSSVSAFYWFLKCTSPGASGGFAPLTPTGALPLDPTRGPWAGPWTPGRKALATLACSLRIAESDFWDFNVGRYDCITKGPQMFHWAIKGPISHFSTLGHLPPPPQKKQFPHCFIKGFQFPHCIIKRPQISIAPSRTPFPHYVIKLITSNFPSRYQEVPIYHCIIKGPPIVTSNFPLHYQGVLIYHCIIKGPHPPPHRIIKGTKISKMYHVYKICTD